MITQGHRYRWRDCQVLAMESQPDPRQPVRVAIIDRALPYPLHPTQRAMAGELVAQPMAYFHGATPR